MRPTLETLVWGGSVPVPSAEWLDFNLVEIANSSYKLSKEELLDGIVSGETWVWYVGEGPSGLALLQIAEVGDEKALVLYGISGKNVVTQGQSIMRDLQKIAAEYGCTEIHAMTTNPKWLAVTNK